MDITVLLSIPSRIRQAGARNAKSRVDRQNKLRKKSRIDRK